MYGDIWVNSIKYNLGGETIRIEKNVVQLLNREILGDTQDMKLITTVVLGTLCMDYDSPEDYAHVRVIVLALGEARHFNWWRSEFLSTTGISYLSRLYPRGKFSSAIHAASRAALDLHDINIGRGNVYHLFRLPGIVEHTFNNMISTQAAELEKNYLPILNDRQSLMEKLSTFIQKKGIYKAGPVQVERQLAAGKMASAYSWAFENNQQIFPYFLL